jgi:hypothetical protein
MRGARLLVFATRLHQLHAPNTKFRLDPNHPREMQRHLLRLGQYVVVACMHRLSVGPPTTLTCSETNFVGLSCEY